MRLVVEGRFGQRITDSETIVLDWGRTQ